jgi:hypothetical protein
VASGELPHVSYNDFEIVDVLGCGRNGAVFKVRWRGQEAAMKQFDVGKDGYGPFDSELAVYMKLRDAWSVLVPTPLFLSVSGGVLFLGLELGRDPKRGDDVYYQSEHWPNVLRSLEEYGICHSDAEERNALLIKDANGSDRLVAIDLEHWLVRGELNGNETRQHPVWAIIFFLARTHNNIKNSVPEFDQFLDNAFVERSSD